MEWTKGNAETSPAKRFAAELVADTGALMRQSLGCWLSAAATLGFKVANIAELFNFAGSMIMQLVKPGEIADRLREKRDAFLACNPGFAFARINAEGVCGTEAQTVGGLT